MASNKRMVGFILVGLLVVLILAVVISPFASSWPDGLEKVAADKGFLEKGEGPQAWKFPLMPDYVMPLIRGSKLATGLAGLIGTVFVLVTSWGLAHLLKKRPNGAGGPGGGREAARR